MKLSAIVAALVCMVLCGLAESARAEVKGLPEVKGIAPNPRVRVVYERISDPKSPLQSIRKRLEEGRVLERISQFLSPLRLPQTVTIAAESCGQERRRYKKGSNRVTICYELVERLEAAAYNVYVDNPKQHRATVVGAFTQSALHEIAHALFDIYRIPIWGRIDDAADRLAALTMIMFGEDQARLAIFGTLDALIGKKMEWSDVQFASLESPEFQRAYNFMCIAVFSDPITFEHWLRNNSIPQQRIGHCRQEHAQIRRAFNLQIMPYVDPDRLVLLRTRRWLP